MPRPPRVVAMAARVLLPLLLAALSLASPAEAAGGGHHKLPPFIHRCSLKDPMLNKCALRNGRAALPHLMKGIPEMRMPRLDPLNIQGIEVHTGSRPSSLDMISRNIVITGLATTDIKTAEIDLENQIYSTNFVVSRIQMMSDYKIDGRVLVLPIHGNGKANFTFMNVTMTYVQPYTIVKKDGLLYHDLPDSTISFNCSRAYFHLDNLFNGDRILGDNVNNFLNENWKEVIDDLSEPFMEATAQVIHQYLLAMVTSVPYSEIFLDAE